MKKFIVSVIGSSNPSLDEYQFAYNLGRELAKRSIVIVCGGKEGIMEGVCKGAKEHNGITIGIMPSYDGNEANKYVDITINTGMGHSRNIIVVASGNIVVAIGKSHGTLSELAFALILKKPIFGYRTYKIEGVEEYEHLEDMISDIEKLIP